MDSNIVRKIRPEDIIKVKATPEQIELIETFRADLSEKMEKLQDAGVCGVVFARFVTDEEDEGINTSAFSGLINISAMMVANIVEFIKRETFNKIRKGYSDESE